MSSYLWELCLVLTLCAECDFVRSNGVTPNRYGVPDGADGIGSDLSRGPVFTESEESPRFTGNILNEDQRVLKRTRRYLTFPEGSTFSFAFCMTVKVLTPDDPDIFSEAVALATSYDLPNNTRALGLFSDKEEATKLSRRQRSYIYAKAENILDKLGFPGKDCILRTICEGAQQLAPADNLLTEILRLILRFPDEYSGMDEPKEQWVYLGAYRAGLHNSNCPDLYPFCSVSFVSAILSLRPV